MRHGQQPYLVAQYVHARLVKQRHIQHRAVCARRRQLAYAPERGLLHQRMYYALQRAAAGIV